MAVTTKKTFTATSNSTTTTFGPIGIELNNQDDLDVYITESGGTRVLQLKQSTASTADSNHPQVGDTTGLYWPAVSSGTSLKNYTISADNNNIIFNSALPSGAVVSCERRTRDGSSDYTNFSGGSTIRSTSLNTALDETRFTAQEARNRGIVNEIDIDARLEKSGGTMTGAITFDSSQTFATSKLSGTITPSDNTVTSAKIVDGAIVDADINGSAAIGLSKLATGALPSGITVASSNIVDGTIVAGDLASNSVTTDKITDGNVTTAKIATGALDGRYYTETEADARFYKKTGSPDEVIKSSETWPTDGTKDDFVVTPGSVDARIVTLVDEVGGFVAIDNETSFPNTNPDVNDGAGTIVSIKSLASAFTSSGSGVATIANGTVGNSTVTINGLANSTTYGAGLGMLVETTSTLNTYKFHRSTPLAADVAAVAAKSTEIGRLGTADAVADMAILGTTDCVADMAILGTTDVVADLNTLGTSDVVSDMNTLATSANVTAMDNCSGSISNINTVSGSISNVNTVATNISGVNDFAERYRVAGSAPTSSLDVGDLYFNTSSNELQVYNGSSWQGGVTATGNLVSTAGSTMTGDLVMDNQADIRFEEATANGNNYIALQAPAAISSNVTLTLPAADGTNGQTLTTNGSGTLSWASGGADKMPLAGGTFTGNITLNAQQDIRFADADSSNWVAFQAPATVSSNVTWTLPAADGTSGQRLQTDGSGALSWGTDSSTDSTKMPLAGGTFTGNVLFSNGKAARFYENDGNGSNYVGFRAPAALSADTTFYWPSADGSANQLLTTDGSGNLSFADAPSAGATGGGNDEIFVENQRTVTTSYTVPDTKNAHSVGPIAINNNIVVTISANSTWLVL